MQHLKLIAPLALAITLSACGGGSSSPAAPATTPDVVAPLSVYVGTWKDDCIFHAQETTIISMSPTVSGALEANLRTDYFDNANCTGSIQGTSTQSANLTISYIKSIDTFAALIPSGGASAVRVDQISASAPASFDTITGVGVKNTTNNGKAQWCIAFSNGDSVCVNNDGISPARSATGAMLLRNNELFLLSPSGTSYSVDQKYTKK